MSKAANNSYAWRSDRASSQSFPHASYEEDDPEVLGHRNYQVHLRERGVGCQSQYDDEGDEVRVRCWIRNQSVSQLGLGQRIIKLHQFSP